MEQLCSRCTCQVNTADPITPKMLNRPMSSLLFRPAELFGLILDDASKIEESGGEPIKNLCIVAVARKKAGLGEPQDFMCV